MLNFFILDVLYDSSSLTVSELVDVLNDEYLSAFDLSLYLDEATLRLKLKEYEALGLLSSKKDGKQLRYSRNIDTIPLQQWSDALAFYSEEDPLGVVGSYLLDKLPSTPEYYHFKHHYILHALESEILEDLLTAIDKKLQVKIHIFNPKKGSPTSHAVTPLRIVISTQGGRRYLMAHSHSDRRINLFRLDTIRKVELSESDEYFNDYLDRSYKFIENMWVYLPV